MQGWKTENCSSLPETLEMVNANTYIQRRNINRIERDSMEPLEGLAEVLSSPAKRAKGKFVILPNGTPEE